MKLLIVKFLTDENISPKVVRALRNLGLDIIDVKERHWCGKEDEELLSIAYQDRRFVFTHDSDFGTLAINEGKPCYGILYLSPKNLQSKNVIRICEQVFNRDMDVYPGTIIVVEETRVRIRHPFQQTDISETGLNQETE